MSMDLHAVLDAMREPLEPETEKIIGNVELLPVVNNPKALSYQDINRSHTLLIKNIPGFLLSQKKIQCKRCDSLLTLWGKTDAE